MKDKRWVTVALVIALIVFTLQNAQAVRVHLLFWGLEASQAVVIFVSFAAGAVAGMLVRGGRRTRRT